MNNIKMNTNEQSLFAKFASQKALIEEKRRGKNDILTKPPLRYMAYSNEIGAAISPINKSLGTVLWAPALLYLGADIYDKYKNEDNEYNPSAKRSVRQAIFQGLTSVILPTVAIEAGQKIGVRVSSGKQSLSAIDKKELVEFTLNHLDNAVFPREEGGTFADEVVAAFKQKAQANKVKIESRSFKDKVFAVFDETKESNSAISKYLKDKDKQGTIIEYLGMQGKIVDDIMTSEKNIQSDKYVKFFNKKNAKYNNVQVARHDTASKILKDKTINKSLVATASGLVALALMIKPIDFFVEEVLMEKIVNPIFDKIPAKKNKNEIGK